MTDRRLARRRTVPVLLGVLLVACLYYQAYRYPLQINSALTSPTYSNTPAWLQYGKWALISALAAALAVSTARTIRPSLPTMSRVRLVAIGVEVLLAGSAVVRLAAGAASIEPWVLLVLAGTGLLVSLVPAVDARTSALVIRVIVVYAVVSVAVELIQVVLYLTLDRLPALAYANSPSVRFGALLDDPNGFAVVLALLIPVAWVALRPRPNLRLVLVIALLCCLPLSQSWTGVTATVVAMTATWAATRGLRRDVRRAAGLVVSAAVVVGVAAYFARSTIAELVRLKQGSAEEHAASFARIAPAPAPAPSDSSTPSLAASAAASHPATAARPGHVADPVAASTWSHGIESGLVNLYVNYGPVLLFAYVALGVIAVVLLLRGRTRLPLALRMGGSSYLICFLLASVNLGLDRTFPCNALYFFFCGLAVAASAPRLPQSIAQRHRRPGAGAGYGRPVQGPGSDAEPVWTTRGPDRSAAPGRPLSLRRHVHGDGSRRRVRRRTVPASSQVAQAPIEGTSS